MTHYVCFECGGVSHTPKNCSTKGCSLEGAALKECNCDKKEHLKKASQSKQDANNE